MGESSKVDRRAFLGGVVGVVLPGRPRLPRPPEPVPPLPGGSIELLGGRVEAFLNGVLISPVHTYSFGTGPATLAGDGLTAASRFVARLTGVVDLRACRIPDVPTLRKLLSAADADMLATSDGGSVLGMSFLRTVSLWAGPADGGKALVNLCVESVDPLPPGWPFPVWPNPALAPVPSRSGGSPRA